MAPTIKTKQKNQSKLSLFFQPASALLGKDKSKRHDHNNPGGNDDKNHKVKYLPHFPPLPRRQQPDDSHRGGSESDESDEDFDICLSALAKKKQNNNNNNNYIGTHTQRTSSFASLSPHETSPNSQKRFKPVEKLPSQAFKTKTNIRKSHATTKISHRNEPGGPDAKVRTKTTKPTTSSTKKRELPTLDKENTSSAVQIGVVETSSKKDLRSSTASVDTQHSPSSSLPPKRKKCSELPLFSSSSSFSTKLTRCPQENNDNLKEEPLDRTHAKQDPTISTTSSTITSSSITPEDEEEDSSSNTDVSLPIPNGRARPGSRYWSSSSMEYSPSSSSLMAERRMHRRRFPPTSAVLSNNVVHQLLHRSVVNTQPWGSPTVRHVPQPKWKSPSWLHLAPPTLSYATAAAGGRTSTVDLLAWDRMGVLLATASNATRTICIYDWDMVRAAHQQAMNEKQRTRVAAGLQKKKQKQQESAPTQEKKEDSTPITPPSTSTSTPLPPRSQWSIPPILEFTVPYTVTSLTWNPYNLDQLAVGFQFSGTVHLYHVDLVMEWKAKRTSQARLSHNSWNVRGDAAEVSNLSAPNSTYTSLSLPRATAGGSALSLLFLSPSTLLVCLGKLGVYCWELSETSSSSSSSSPRTSRLQWKYQPHRDAIVHSMTCLGPEWLVLGTDQGSFLVVRWTQTTSRQKRAAFSTGIESPKPLVIHEWIPTFDKEDEHFLDLPRRKLVVSKVHIEALGSTTTVESSAKGGDTMGPPPPNTKKERTGRHRKRQNWPGRCRIIWTTQCGWGLSMTVDLPSSSQTSYSKTKESCHVWYAPPKLILQNADGTVIDPTDNGSHQQHDNFWSLPLLPVASDHAGCESNSQSCNPNANGTITCWTSVPAVTKILPHHNKYVLDSQPQILRTSESVLLWKDWRQSSDDTRGGEGKIQKIPIPKSWTTPMRIAVHPSHEWIVVGGMEQHHLGVLSARG